MGALAAAAVEVATTPELEEQVMVERGALVVAAAVLAMVSNRKDRYKD